MIIKYILFQTIIKQPKQIHKPAGRLRPATRFVKVFSPDRGEYNRL